MVKNDNLAPQKARLNFHQGILNSMLFNLFRPMTPTPPVDPSLDAITRNFRDHLFIKNVYYTGKKQIIPH